MPHDGPGRLSAPAWLSDEERELLERTARGLASVRLTLIDAASAHVHMAPDEHSLDGRQRAEAGWWIERLTAVLCEMEELGLEAVGDDLLPGAAVALLGDLEKSFLLALSTESAERRSKVLSVEEVGDRILALDAEGTWARQPSVARG